MNHRSTLVALLCLLAAPAVFATDGLDDRAERARIKTERAAAEADFLARERECRARFVVTACVNEARRQQREILARLRGEEEVLDDARRKQRAAQRAEAIREKVRRDEAREAEAANPERREANRRATAPHITVRQPDKAASEPRHAPRMPGAAASAADRKVDEARGARHALAVPGPAASAVDRKVDEARSESVYESRARAARAHREAVETRNAERARRGKVAAPLPAGGASAP